MGTRKVEQIVVDEFPLVWSDERMHEAGSECWCHPDVIEGVEVGEITVRHHSAVG